MLVYSKHKLNVPHDNPIHTGVTFSKHSDSWNGLSKKSPNSLKKLIESYNDYTVISLQHGSLIVIEAWRDEEFCSTEVFIQVGTWVLRIWLVCNL